MALNGDMGDQTAPVEYVDKPACGIRGHGHPVQDYVGCVAALMETLNRRPDREPMLPQALGDEWFSRNLADRSAFHRALCEPRFTNLRDLDTAFEMEGGVKARAAEYAQRSAGSAA
jgi:hypothetical protein